MSTAIGVPGTVYPGIPGHEARHLAAAVCLGLDVTEARADCPDPDTAGYVTVIGPMRTPREFGLMVLVGNADRDDWPPEWPSKSADHSDERRLAEVIERLALDRGGYHDLCAEAWKLAGSRSFALLEAGYAALMENGNVLDRRDIAHVKSITENEMEHKLKSAAATITDLGEFEALAATWGLDRAGERIRKGAFAKTITRWAGRPVPCHWDHKGEPEFVIGAINEMRETSDGLRVRGWLDLEGSSVAREAWRAMRSGAVGLSFGFLVTKSHPEGDVRVLDEIDLFEVSLTGSPVNPDTRVLSMKGGLLQIASFDA